MEGIVRPPWDGPRSSRLNGVDPRFWSEGGGRAPPGPGRRPGRSAVPPVFPGKPGAPRPPWHVPCWETFPAILSGDDRSFAMNRRTPRVMLLSAALLAAGCSEYKPFDSAGYLRHQYAREIGAQEAARVEVPFELDDEIRGSLGKLPKIASELRRVNQVNEFIFDGLQLQYALAPTKNAVETFRTRSGNCLSFVNLFVGVARELG